MSRAQLTDSTRTCPTKCGPARESRRCIGQDSDIAEIMKVLQGSYESPPKKAGAPKKAGTPKKVDAPRKRSPKRQAQSFAGCVTSCLVAYELQQQHQTGRSLKKKSPVAPKKASPKKQAAPKKKSSPKKMNLV